MEKHRDTLPPSDEHKELIESCPSIEGQHIILQIGQRGEINFPHEYPPRVEYEYIEVARSPEELERVAQERKTEIGQVHFQQGTAFLLDSHDPGTVILDIFLDQFINEHPDLVDDITIIEHVHVEEDERNASFSENDSIKNEFMRKIMPNCVSRLIYKGKIVDVFPTKG